MSLCIHPLSYGHQGCPQLREAVFSRIRYVTTNSLGLLLMPLSYLILAYHIGINTRTKRAREHLESYSHWFCTNILEEDLKGYLVNGLNNYLKCLSSYMMHSIRRGCNIKLVRCSVIDTNHH